jgi:hypothetical protein
MKSQHFQFAAALSATLFGFAGQAIAQDLQDSTVDAQAVHTLGQHPAVLVHRRGLVLDTNRFILAHPAQLAVIDAPSPTYADLALRPASNLAAAVCLTPVLPGKAAAAASSGPNTHDYDC